MISLALVLPLTLILGSSVALAFIVVGRSLHVALVVAREQAPLIYLLVAGFAAAVLFVVARPLAARLTLVGLAALVIGAWLGEWLVLALGLIADEITLMNAHYYWLLATGGPLQPLAAFVGGWFRMRSRA